MPHPIPSVVVDHTVTTAADGQCLKQKIYLYILLNDTINSLSEVKLRFISMQIPTYEGFTNSSMAEIFLKIIPLNILFEADANCKSYIAVRESLHSAVEQYRLIFGLVTKEEVAIACKHNLLHKIL